MQRLRDKRKDLRSSFMSHFLACDDKSCTRLNDLLGRIFLRAKLVMLFQPRYYHPSTTSPRHTNVFCRLSWKSFAFCFLVQSRPNTIANQDRIVIWYYEGRWNATCHDLSCLEAGHRSLCWKSANLSKRQIFKEADVLPQGRTIHDKSHSNAPRNAR